MSISDYPNSAKADIHMREYKRTMGVSTTDIVNRMLLGTPAKPLQEWPLLQEFAEPIIGTHKGNKVWRLENNALTEVIKGPAVSADDKVIYAAGDWDLFRNISIFFRKFDHLVIVYSRCGSCRAAKACEGAGIIPHRWSIYRCGLSREK